MTPAIHAMLDRYQCQTEQDFVNALKEIIQEIALLGLWRSKFFEKAAFYGGTSLRILYGLDRFSEDLDFSLLKPDHKFKITPYLKAIEIELSALGFAVAVEERKKTVESNIESAFIKAGTKEHLIKIEVPRQLTERVQHNEVLKIKIEVDTDPPGNFKTETKILLLPIPFSVNTYQQSDLFAGKMHAILERDYKTRVKGRDYYDLVWYLARNTPLHLAHLHERLRQTGKWSQGNGWNEKTKLNRDSLLNLCHKKFSEVNFEKAKGDVAPFIRNQAALGLWSKGFFEDIISKLNAI